MAIETIATDDAVFKIASELQEAGKKVSVRAIAAALGGGGMNTVSAALRRWKQNQELKSVEPVKLAELPSHLIDVMHSATIEIWNAAQAEAKAEIERLTIDFNARLLEAHQERDDALAELEEATNELKDATTKFEKLFEDNKILYKSITETTENLQDAQKATENAENEAKTAEAINHELKSRVEQLTEMYKQEKEASTKVVKECRELEEKLAFSQQEKARIEGMLTVYESIGGSSSNKQEEPPKAKRPHKAEVKNVN